METVTLSTDYRLDLPRELCDRLRLKPGAKLTLIEKGGTLYLVRQRRLSEFRGIARGARADGLRDKSERF